MKILHSIANPAFYPLLLLVLLCHFLFCFSNDERLSTAALESIRQDPGLQQLVPYLVQFVVDKVATHSKTLPILMSMMKLVQAMLDNPNLFVEPYVGVYGFIDFEL